jgi:hypothetical protein
MSGSEKTISQGSFRQPNAATTAIGVRARSIPQIQTMNRSRLRGETPRPRRSRSAVLAKSNPNCATSARP